MNSSASHSRRFTSTFGSTGQPPQTFSQTQSQTSTTNNTGQKPLSKPQVQAITNAVQFHHSTQNHLRNQSNLGNTGSGQAAYKQT